MDGKRPPEGASFDHETGRHAAVPVPVPWYFALISGVDRWVVFDTAQYPRHGWVNRNRILHPTHGWQYIVAPLVSHRREARICDVQVVEGRGWRERIERQLEHYRGRAPHYDAVRRSSATA